MEETQQLKSTPLPVAKIFKEALKFPFHQTRQFWIWVLILCLVSFAISFVQNYFLGVIREEIPLKVMLGISMVLEGISVGLIFTLVAIGCHRMIILEEKNERWVDFFRWSNREIRFFIWSFLIYFLGMLLLLLPIFIGSPNFLQTGIDAVMEYLVFMDYFLINWLIPNAWIQKIWIYVFTMGIPLMEYFLFLYVLSRASLVLPATAIDEKATLSWAWDRSTGNGWRLTLMTTIPFIIVLCLVGSGLDMMDFMQPPLFWIPEFIGSAMFVLWGMLEAALLSGAYKELRLQRQVPNFKMLD